jgi:hypothetical protein
VALPGDESGRRRTPGTDPAAIVECELYERIFQGSCRVIPAFTGQDAGAAG